MRQKKHCDINTKICYKSERQMLFKDASSHNNYVLKIKYSEA